MAAINEAWHVLSDPRRRAAYDAAAPSGVAATGSSSTGSSFNTAARSTASTSVVPPPIDPPRFPWRGVVIFAVVGSIVVIVLSVIQQPAGPRPIDNVLTAGSCVVLEANGDVSEVRCDEPHDAVVDRLVPLGSRCPAGTETRRDRQGMGLACLRP